MLRQMHRSGYTCTPRTHARGTMSVTFHALPPSANSACTRCVLKCAGIEHEEVNAYGQTRTPEYIAKFITNLAPAIEHDGACVSETNAIGTPRVSRSHSWTHRPHVSGTHHSDAQPSPRDLTQISSRGVA